MWWSLDRADALADVSMAPAGTIVPGEQGVLPAGLDGKRGKACRFYGTAAGTYCSLFLWFVDYFCWEVCFHTRVIGG